MNDDKTEKRENQEVLDPASKKADRHKEIVVAEGPTLIMDMSWGHFMNEHSQKKVIQQISISYAFSKKADTSIPFIFTSVDQIWHDLFDRVNAFQWNKNIVRFEENPLTDIDIPLDDMIYLTADTDNVCTSIDPKKYYIIGCLLDHNSKKGVTHDFAVEHNIRMERLPISEHITMEGRQVLTINQVVEIMIRVANGISWGDALVRTIPSRKRPAKVEKIEEKTEKKTKRKKDRKYKKDDRSESNDKDPNDEKVRETKGFFSDCNLA